MEYALDKQGNRVNCNDADKRNEYFCPLCATTVIPRQGECNTWHFAHIEMCEDQWKYDMSDWHYNWQRKFPEATREKVISCGNAKHRADVQIGKYIIEFQHSSISAAEFSERNRFYTNAGYKVIWLFDFAWQFENEQIYRNDNDNHFYWKYANRVISSVVPQKNKNVTILFELEHPSEENEFYLWVVRVEWAKPVPGDTADYSQFFIDSDFRFSLTKETDLEWIVLNTQDRLNKLLRENVPYKKKCSRMKGNPHEWDICPITNDWHDNHCYYCQHNLITERRNPTKYKKGGRYFYCCYPRVINEADEYGNIYVDSTQM